MKHLVLGNGNLGADLFEEIKRRGHECTQWVHGDKFDYPHTPLRGLDAFDYIWCAVGAGSVQECSDNFRHAIDLHVHLPQEIVKQAPQAQLIFFSTDYIESPPASLYALSKYYMEHALAFHMNWGGLRNIKIVRVGSLYGKHRSEKNLSQKIESNKDDSVKLPSNEIRPTPTKWVAETLCDRLGSIPPIFHLCPSDSVSVANFGRIVTTRKIEVGAIDIQRPRVISPSCPYWREAPTWKELWDKYNG